MSSSDGTREPKPSRSARPTAADPFRTATRGRTGQPLTVLSTRRAGRGSEARDPLSPAAPDGARAGRVRPPIGGRPVRQAPAGEGRLPSRRNRFLDGEARALVPERHPGRAGSEQPGGQALSRPSIDSPTSARSSQSSAWAARRHRLEQRPSRRIEARRPGEHRVPHRRGRIRPGRECSTTKNGFPPVFPELVRIGLGPASPPRPRASAESFIRVTPCRWGDFAEHDPERMCDVELSRDRSRR